MAAVVGRDRELAAVRDALDRGARVVLIEGELGIGKTTVWRATVAHTVERGARVLSCAASQAEAQLAFTVVRDLVDGVFDEVADSLPEPQRHALAVALLREEPGARPLDPGAISAAFLGTLSRLAAKCDVVVAVDDAQWIDPASANVLRYALRRLTAVRVTAIVARRTDESDPLELARLAHGVVERIVLGGLSVGAVARALHDRLARTFTRPVLVRLHELSGGNPFYALEVARALPDDAGHVLPMPPTVRQLVLERVETLPQDTVAALEVVAALGRATIETVRAATRGDAAALLEPAVGANVLDVDGDEIRFAHPIFAAVVYDRAALRRRDLHAQLAELVSDPEQRARHLALANELPSEEVAALVEDGAALGFARGSPATAAELAAEAVRLTPAGERAALGRRLLAAADYEFAAGNTARASALLDELLADAAPGPERARLLGRLGRVRHFERNIGASVALLYAALDGAADADRGEIEEGLAWGLLLSRRDLGVAAEHARSAVAIAKARGNSAALAEALAAQAVTEFVLGRPWESTISDALALEEATLELRVLRHPSFAHGYILSCADELDAARTTFEQLRARAEDAGDESSVPSLLNHLTLVECLAGRWDLAAAYADECHARALESNQRPTQTSVLGKVALLASRRGDTDAARDAATAALGEDFDPADPTAVMEHGGETAAWALASAELDVGRAAEAQAILGPLVDALLAAGVRQLGELRFLADEIDALVVLGALERAASFVDTLGEWAVRDGRPSALAAAARSQALLDAARGEADAAVEALSRAAELAAGAGLPYEHARTLVELGAQQRRARQRRAARETLEVALATAEELGAARVAERARSELARIGGRRASGDELTPNEERVAELVAAGKTNKEVAAVLVVAERTVESTLTQIYRKLDVRSRTELARRLAGR